MIECRNLCKVYGDQVALSDLNLKLEAGDAFGFIGPNGAGKTTTIRILATLLEPTRGEAFVGGYSVLREPDDVRRILGYMPDQFGIYDGMRAHEYLDFFAAAYRVPKFKRAALIQDVLEITDLVPKREAFVETLSAGMKQRLCLAKTLLHDPQVLVLDEPASGLDPRARIELRELIRELSRMGKTLCVSSHILPELADFCNKVGILEGGVLLAAGPVESILAKASARVRSLRIVVLGDAARTEELLARWAPCENLQREAQTLRLETAASLEEQADLLEQLIQERVRPVQFAEEKTDLEKVFMQVTRGTLN